MNHTNNDENPTNNPTNVAIAMIDPMNTPQNTSNPSPSEAPIFSAECTDSCAKPGITRKNTIPYNAKATASTPVQNAEVLPNSCRCLTCCVNFTSDASFAFFETW